MNDEEEEESATDGDVVVEKDKVALPLRTGESNSDASCENNKVKIVLRDQEAPELRDYVPSTITQFK